MARNRMQPNPSGDPPPLREALQQFLRLVTLVRPYWTPLIKGMALGLVLGLVGMVLPYLSKLLIDQVYPTGDTHLMEILVGGILAMSVTQMLLSGIRGYFTSFTTSHLTSATNLLFFNHLQHLPVAFFDEHRVGEIMSRFADVRSSLGSVSKVFETLFVKSVYLLLVPPFLFMLQWKLALVALSAIPVSTLITTLSARLLRKYWKRSAEARAELNAYQVEVLSHIRTLKSLAVEPQVYRSAQEQSKSVLRLQLTASGLGQIFGSASGLVRALGTALYTWFAWRLVLGGEMTLGSFIAFSSYLGYLSSPLAQVTGLFSEFQQTAVNLGRMFEYLDAQTEQDPAASYTPAQPLRQVLRGEIDLRDVSFGYDPGQPVLRGIDLHVRSGELVAIVGQSGAGKSSLLRLIGRTFDPESGILLFDGTDAREMALPDIRRQMAVVWQDFALLKGTIWENLTLGAEHATRAGVEEAIRLCRVEELLRELPEGYDTVVGEWGATLSGGQRQRLALARAIIRDVPLLLLDEATSNLDRETERAILSELLPSLAGKTVVYATHRMATAALAPHIVVLERGEIAAEGTHVELLQRSESYRRLVGADEAFEEGPRLRVVAPPR